MIIASAVNINVTDLHKSLFDKKESVQLNKDRRGRYVCSVSYKRERE